MTRRDLADYGINDNVIKAVPDKVTEGMPAEFQGVDMALVASNLSAEREIALCMQFEDSFGSRR